VTRQRIETYAKFHAAVGGLAATFGRLLGLDIMTIIGLVVVVPVLVFLTLCALAYHNVNKNYPGRRT
jgi:uncharacterized membrane protein